LKAEASGFRTLIENATVQVGQITTVELAMQVGAASEVVSVQGEAAQIDYDSHTISGVITRQEIENLPLNGRSFLQLAMLEPGVTVSANSVGQYNRLFDVNILGADSGNGSVRITVDGATIADSVTGGTQQNFSQEVVQEFQLSSTNMDLSNAIGAGGGDQYRDARRHQRFSWQRLFLLPRPQHVGVSVFAARGDRAGQSFFCAAPVGLRSRRTDQEGQAVFLLRPRAHQPGGGLQRVPERPFVSAVRVVCSQSLA
jgi:hypothetical protein